MIDVNVELPSNPLDVLVLCDDIYSFDIGRFSEGKWKTRTFGDSFKVTHWQPLPLLPFGVAEKLPALS